MRRTSKKSHWQLELPPRLYVTNCIMTLNTIYISELGWEQTLVVNFHTFIIKWVNWGNILNYSYGSQKEMRSQLFISGIVLLKSWSQIWIIQIKYLHGEVLKFLNVGFVIKMSLLVVSFKMFRSWWLNIAGLIR